MKITATAWHYLVLTLHITSARGWLSAVTAFLALAIAGRTGMDPQLVRAAYLAMDLTGWTIIFLLGVAALVTGVIQTLGRRLGADPALVGPDQAPDHLPCNCAAAGPSATWPSSPLPITCPPRT